MIRVLLLFLMMALASPSYASISCNDYVTADDVTISNLQTCKNTVVNAINSFDGSLIQNGSVTAAKLDANASPENRWNEAFNDFVYTGLTIPTSVSLSSTTTAGTAYINGTRVVKDATAKTYDAQRWTFVDLSSTGVYTYSTVSFSATEPSVATNSIRLARVSTDSTTVLSVRDDRVTNIVIATGSATNIADTDNDTKIQTQESTDEDIIRFDLGNATLSSAREVLTIQAVSAEATKLEPTTTGQVDLGSSSKKYRDVFTSGTVSNDGTTYIASANIDGGSMDNVKVAGVSMTGELYVNSSTDKLVGLGSQGTSGQFLQSQGAGANPTFSGATLTLTSTTTTSGADNTGDITIAASKKYLVVFTMKKQQTGAGTVYLRFNSNAGASSYAWSYTTLDFATSVTETHVGDNADDEIEISPVLTTDDVDTIVGQFFLDTTLFNTSYTSYVDGWAVYQNTSTTYGRIDFGGMIIDAGGVGAITSFELLDSGTTNDDWIVKLYEIGT